MAGRYHFLTEMELTSPPDSVEYALSDYTRWPTWWRWARQVESLDGASPGSLGARYRYRVTTPFRYGFTYVTEVIETSPSHILVESSGDLEGSGLFRFSRTEEQGTALSFTWLVQTSKWWMNLVSPIARPAFVWNHDLLMTNFAEGLARVTNGDLIAVTHTVVPPSDPAFFTLTVGS
ncbi:MAG: polyketide cyclase [Acidimicrobiia bacterium]